MCCRFQTHSRFASFCSCFQQLSEERDRVNFDYSQEFELHDDNIILTAIGEQLVKSTDISQYVEPHLLHHIPEFTVPDSKKSGIQRTLPNQAMHAGGAGTSSGAGMTHSSSAAGSGVVPSNPAASTISNSQAAASTHAK
jgi:hypothetical protein